MGRGRLARTFWVFGRWLAVLSAIWLARIEPPQRETLASQRRACLGCACLEEVRHGSAHSDLGAALSHTQVQVQIPVRRFDRHVRCMRQHSHVQPLVADNLGSQGGGVRR
jgi:hypothetical protein